MNRFTKENKGLLKEHFVVLKNLWKYIVEIEEFALAIGRLEYILEDLSLYIYGDISFTDNLIMCVSIRSYIIFLAGYLVI